MDELREFIIMRVLYLMCLVLHLYSYIGKYHSHCMLCAQTQIVSWQAKLAGTTKQNVRQTNGKHQNQAVNVDALLSIRACIGTNKHQLSSEGYMYVLYNRYQFSAFKVLLADTIG